VAAGRVESENGAVYARRGAMYTSGRVSGPDAADDA
jgi:hypothetical protein